VDAKYVVPLQFPDTVYVCPLADVVTCQPLNVLPAQIAGSTLPDCAALLACLIVVVNCPAAALAFCSLILLTVTAIPVPKSTTNIATVTIISTNVNALFFFIMDLLFDNYIPH
jgi:hypothetical protein